MRFWRWFWFWLRGGPAPPVVCGPVSVSAVSVNWAGYSAPAHGDGIGDAVRVRDPKWGGRRSAVAFKIIQDGRFMSEVKAPQDGAWVDVDPSKVDRLHVLLTAWASVGRRRARPGSE